MLNFQRKRTQEKSKGKSESEAKLEIARQNTFYRDVINSIPYNIVTCDLSGKIRFISREFAQTLLQTDDVDFAKLIDLPLAQLNKIFDRKQFHNLGNRLGEMPIYQRVRLEDQTLMVTVTPLQDETGAETGFILSAEVITDQVKMGRNCVNLSQKVQEAADKLNTLSNDLAENSAEGSDLAGHIREAGDTTAQQANHVSSTAEQMTQSISEISSQIDRLTEVANRAVS
ncbi:hypothetical protein TH25_22260, partial [Thalassospira profundimaris]